MANVTKNVLTAKKIDAIFKGVMVIAGMILFGWCFRWACLTLVQLQNPAWLTALTTTLGVLTYLVGPMWLQRLTERRIRRHTEDFHARLCRLEAIIDRGRTSSGLQVDGTDPPEGAVE